MGVACENGHAETARVLLNHGANLDFQNEVYTNAVMVISVDLHGEMW